MSMFSWFIALFNICIIINGISLAPIDLQLTQPNQVQQMKFNVQLPTNETVQIKLSFKLLTTSPVLSVYDGTSDPVNYSKKNEVSVPGSLTKDFLAELTDSHQLQQVDLVTVEEVIEKFRKHLIEKELEIAGIIESEYPFYRHFRLEFEDGVVIPIRCTYEAHAEKDLLEISCYQYQEFELGRFLSNGEIENTEALFAALPEYIDARNMKQTYNMTIS